MANKGCKRSLIINCCAVNTLQCCMFSSCENPSCIRIFQDRSAGLEEKRKKGMNVSTKLLKAASILTSDPSKVSVEVKKNNVVETKKKQKLSN